MIKIAILDDYQDVSKKFMKLEKFENKCEFKIFNEPFSNEDEAIDCLKDFNVLIIMRERTKISQELISKCNKLKLIITTGMRNKAIDVESVKEKKIIVSGTEIHSNPAAELTWTLIMGLARNIKEEVDNMFQGYWQTTLGVELKGKILGIIGLGKIGKQVAKVGKAFGMQVVAWSENLSLETTKELGILSMTKSDLIKNSDFISLHVVYGKRYKDLFTKKEFKEMKKTAFLINTSRGPIINEVDLINALESNTIAGVGLDVYNEEPLSQGHKLRFLPNAFILPHVGYVTVENYSLFYTQIEENLQAYIDGSPIRLIN
ncbi:MAG: hydroxyacid dehydrogenase [Candidatus Pelagibacter sp.]|nr:hydroxyacid dehydrogenase [Candidatus Pelagibacter sp.]|tara:strand:- start:11858 stop:12808 length:951 start_codon:yes stop_codon:yes gene_type:complete